MLSYPSTVALSTRTLNHLADLIRAHRTTLRSRWRRLDPGQQALLVLAHLRDGDTYTRLAAGFAIGPPAAAAFGTAGRDLPRTRLPSGGWGTGGGHPQLLKSVDEAALLPTPRHRNLQAILALHTVETNRYPR